MIKNQANIYQFILRDMIGQGMTGLSPTVQIRKDSGSFAATTNTPTEVGYGLYELTLTATECNCDIMAIKVSLPDGQFPAILENERLTTTGGATPAEIWQYTGGRTVDNTIPTVNEIWGRQSGDTTSRTLTNLNIQSELTTYGAAKTSDLSELSTFDPSTDDVTINATQAATLAAASDLDSVATKVELIKSKTDNLPENPAAVTDVTTAQAAIIAAMPDISGLSTFNAATDTVTINATQAAGMVTADVSGLATTADISDAVTDIQNYGQEHWQTANLSGLATSSELETAESNIISAMPDISGLPTAADIWEYTDRTLTEEISVEISDENIRDITDMVWNADDRTLTDLTPKPNQKNIVCTPTNVLNSYGLQRMENWTNEQAGTAAFDTIVNNYIALAKEQMAVDLNNHINAAINYVGADTVTELCAWLTGYKLYSDDESRTTDNLPETRYNMYLEQIHRIMENV